MSKENQIKLLKFPFRAKVQVLNKTFHYYLHTVPIYDSSFRGTIAVSALTANILSTRTKGTFLERVLPENIYTEMTSMVFPHFHKFFEIFDEKIQQLITGGFVGYLAEFWTKTDNKKKYAHLYFYLSEPQVLTLKHLEAGFVIWLISICVAIFSFVLEWLMKLFEIFLNRFVYKKIKTKKKMKRSRKHT